jgi:glycerophosphoryl diester phosphodiesterase
MEIKARSAIVPVGLICERASQLKRWSDLPCDCVMVHYTLLTHRLVHLIQTTGRKVFAWTVNDSAWMLRLANWGVNGLISDDTRLLAQTLG